MQGSQVSTKLDDVILTLYENAIGTAETWTITVIWVKDWSLRTGAASESDAKISYQLKYQTSNLGLLGTPTTWGQRHFGGLIAYEM